MKRVLFAVGFLALVASAKAGSNSSGFETVTIASEAAVGVTASLYASSSTTDIACGALISIETADIRFRTDGTDPTNSVGHKVVAGDSFLVDSLADLARLRMIGVSADGTAPTTVVRGCK